MKRFVFSLCILIGCTAYSWAEMQGTIACEEYRVRRGYQYFYCDCVESAVMADFGVDLAITDTLWFTASMDEIRHGLAAYWFSESTVVIEAYAFCTSDVPTMVLMVGGNQMREMSTAEILSKLDDKLGSVSIPNPKLRVYPRDGGTGRVMLFNYDQGPESTCENTFPVLNGMTYVSGNAHNVYEWQPDKITTTSHPAIQWKQRDNLPCQLTVTLGSCDGDTVASMLLSDSTKLYYPDSLMLVAARQANQSLFLHVEHDSSYVGRVRFHLYPKYIEMPMVDTTFCQGRGLQLVDTLLKEPTTYGPDTLWMKHDTLGVFTYHVSIIEPDTLQDTLNVKKNQLPMLYRRQYVIGADAYGEHGALIHTDTCDVYYRLQVNHAVSTIYNQLDTAICEGKSILLGGKTYTSDYQVNDTTWEFSTPDVDTRIITDYSITFLPPNDVYDTVYVAPSKMPYYSKYGVVRTYGDYTYRVEKYGRCTELLHLSVLEGEEEIITDLNAANSPRRPYKIVQGGQLLIYRDGKYYSVLGNAQADE